VDDPFIPVIVDPGSPAARIFQEINCLAVVSDAVETCAKSVGTEAVGKPEALFGLSIRIARTPTCAPDGIVIVEAVDVALATNAHSCARPEITE